MKSHPQMADLDAVADLDPEPLPELQDASGQSVAAAPVHLVKRCYGFCQQDAEWNCRNQWAWGRNFCINKARNQCIWANQRLANC